ncbi:retrovirus-related Pol polyprotein from transposon 17.6 [Trichonephila clavipes]|nr:retrovirus-related Pol polyprotein from transposon 17.6 [Trichonephila clavipes]
MRLVTSPILKQADGSKPFTIRTDASNYAFSKEVAPMNMSSRKANVVADMLSRPSYTENAASDVCAITVDMPSRKSSDIRKGQLEDEELKKIIDCFESMDKDENFAYYTSRGYLMNQGILYRYSPESEEEEAQLVVPAQERERILQE